MATNSDIFKKFITGEAIGADTDGGQLPVLFEGMPTGHLNAPYSSCSITASAAVTYNGTVYAAGDVLFYSDGYTIFNSTGNQMSGNDATVNGLTGGVRSAPQAVSFMKVSDALSGTVTGGTLPGSTGAIFWCFFNGMENGIRVGIIDMNGDSGKGIFINYLNIGQSGGGLVGVLNNTDGGVCGRMVTQCYNHHTLIVDIEGVAIITKLFVQGAAYTGNVWQVHRLVEINTTTGAPVMYGGTVYTGDPVQSVIGIPTPETDYGRMGTVSITEVFTNTPGATGFNLFKIATIMQEPGIPTAVTQHDFAQLQILNCDLNTGIISSPSTTGVTAHVLQLDRGPITWPQPVSQENRYFSMHSCFSHSSKHDDAIVYYGWFDGGSAPAGELKVGYRTFDTNNNLLIQSPVNYGQIVDGTGNNIWIGQNGPSRIIGGIWRDPQKLGRIFIATPYQTSNLVGVTVGPSDMSWSTSYPEVYGDFNNPPQINLCVLEDTDVPATVTVSWAGSGIADTQMRYGAPAFNYCSIELTTPCVCVQRCGTVGTFTVTGNDQLWGLEYLGAGNGANMNLIAPLSVTDIRGISFNMYTAILYIWDSPTVSTLAYQKYDNDDGVITASTAIAANVTWYKFIDFTNQNVITAGMAIPFVDLEKCQRHWFLGKQVAAGADENYSIGKVDTILNTVENYVVAANIDIANDLGGVLAGLIPVSITCAGQGDNPVAGTNTYFFVALGTRIIKYDLATTTWSLLTNVAPTAINDIWLQYEKEMKENLLWE